MRYESITKHTLSNGVRLAFHPDDRAKSASLSIAVGSGSRFELESRSGVSHFIEHMLFKGTAKRSAREIAEDMDLIGGQYNAYTTKEYTCVYARVLDSHLPLAFDVLSDMLCSPALAPDCFETERGVILEEIGMYEDSPEDLLVDGIYEASWPGTMLGANILGTRESIEKMTGDELRAHMAQFYTGGRTVCAVSGAFDKEAFIAQAEKSLGCLPAFGEDYSAVPARFCAGEKLVDKDFEQTHFCLGFEAAGRNDEKRFARGILNNVLGGSSSSRLFQRIREELGLAYSVGSSLSPYLCEGIFEVDAAVNPSKEEEALSEIARVLRSFKENGISEKELERAKEQRKAGIVLALEGNSAVAGHISREELMDGHVQSEEELLAGIEKVELGEVNELAKELIDLEHFSFCAVGRVGGGKGYREIISQQ